MNSALLMTKELMRSFGWGAWGLSLLAVGLIALFAGTSAILTALLGPPPAQSEGLLFALPREDLSQAELAQLYERLLADPAIAQVRYAFPPEEGGRGRFEIALRPQADPSAVLARLRGWGLFQEVLRPAPKPPGALKALIQDPKRRWVAFAVLTLLLGLSLLAIWGALAAARRGFSPELELLELSGADPQTMRLPFTLLGGLYGLAASLLVALLLSYGGRALLDHPPSWLLKLLPELIRRETPEGLGLRGFLIGLLLGGLGGLLGRLSYRYPSPLSRSRIASSSVGAKTP